MEANKRSREARARETVFEMQVMQVRAHCTRTQTRRHADTQTRACDAGRVETIAMSMVPPHDSSPQDGGSSVRQSRSPLSLARQAAAMAAAAAAAAEETDDEMRAEEERMRKSWGRVGAAALNLRNSGRSSKKHGIAEAAAAALALARGETTELQLKERRKTAPPTAMRKSVHQMYRRTRRNSIGQSAISLEAPSVAAFAAVAKAAAARAGEDELRRSAGARSAPSDAPPSGPGGGGGGGEGGGDGGGEKPTPPMRQRTQRLTPQRRLSRCGSGAADIDVGRRRSVWRKAAAQMSGGNEEGGGGGGGGGGDGRAEERRRGSLLQALVRDAAGSFGSQRAVAPHPMPGPTSAGSSKDDAAPR